MATHTSLSESCDVNALAQVQNRRSTCIIVVGPSGSGKTKFVEKLVSIFYQTGLPFVINLDPACREVPYPPNVDIRETLDHTDITSRYGLNRNSGIVSTVDLFSARFNEVVSLIENDGEYHEYIIVDTPGQTEMFTSSTSGITITRALAMRFPTVIAYLMDAQANVDPVLFMSNILNACLVMRKIQLPFIMTMSKTDIVSETYAMEWFRDVEAFQEALRSRHYDDRSMINLITSMNQFFKNMKFCGVSSITGAGIPAFFELVQETVEERNLFYIPIQPAAISPISNEPSAELDQQVGGEDVMLAGSNTQALGLHLGSHPDDGNEERVNTDDDANQAENDDETEIDIASSLQTYTNYSTSKLEQPRA